MNDLQAILKDLHSVLGLNISLFDIDENLIASYPCQDSPFCHLIKENPKSREICKKCDHEAFERVKKTGEIEIYRCQFNLSEACVPIYSYGQLTGFLMMGQVISGSTYERNLIFKLARPYIDSDADLKQAIQHLPIKTNNQILAFSTILDLCAKYLTSANTIKIKENRLADAAKKYIIENLDTDITMEVLCEKLYCSKTALIQHFKSAFGTTVHSFLIECRINRSCELLKNKNLSIQQISSMCGFNDTSYFSKVFKKKCKLTPKQYREQME